MTKEEKIKEVMGLVDMAVGNSVATLIFNLSGTEDHKAKYSGEKALEARCSIESKLRELIQ